MPSLKIKYTTLLTFVFISSYSQHYVDIPFTQDYSVKYDKQKSDLNLLDVGTDRNSKTIVVSSEGLLSPWDDKLKPNFQYRPLENIKINDIEVYENQFYFLTNNAVLSLSHGGNFYEEHGLKDPKLFSLANDKSLIVLNNESLVYLSKIEPYKKILELDEKPLSLSYDNKKGRFLILTPKNIYEFSLDSLSLRNIYKGKGLTCFEYHQEKIWVGTNNGIYQLESKNFSVVKIINELPHNEITSLKQINGKLWAGSTRGAFKFRSDGKFDYYASKRWLLDDRVITINSGPDDSVFILTKKGLNKIAFKSMTLEQKASYFQGIQRKRHIRYGLESSVKLRKAGDLSTLELIDTDNDGLWTSMYLASELFRYAVTGSDDAKLNAFEAFEAMEKLTNISDIKGFPARTYEINGYQRSNWNENSSLGVWKNGKDEKWVWKTTTSSDESCGHFFVYALFAEIIKDKEWRNRAIKLIQDQMDHIINNDWYLVSWNGKPTRWGRWNPDYVNSFPIAVGDRRLNSTLILAFLQTAYHFTNDQKYKKHAFNLINEYGYGENASRSANVIGYVEGEMLSDSWNHSDDEMYFLTAPAFVNYAFDDKMKKKHLKAVTSHWQIERSEKNPLWNFLYTLSGGDEIDLEESIWWLKHYPLDLIDWRVENKHRKDLVKLNPNFRKQEYLDVLPRDERPHHLHNAAYKNDGGSDGYREYSPYIYLLPYWAGRYTKKIQSINNR